METARYEKTGYIRWQSILHFFTIDAIKAGFLRKQKGIWILTTEGEEAMQLGSTGLLEKANEAYKVWREKTKDAEVEGKPKEYTVNVQSQKVNLELIQEKALSGLREYIKKLNPYEFQDLVAALLHGMGYYISFIAPRGKDNGLDIIAYQDPWELRRLVLKCNLTYSYLKISLRTRREKMKEKVTSSYLKNQNFFSIQS